jgi:hypothetical protein
MRGDRTNKHVLVTKRKSRYMIAAMEGTGMVEPTPRKEKIHKPAHKKS